MRRIYFLLLFNCIFSFSIAQVKPDSGNVKFPTHIKIRPKEENLTYTGTGIAPQSADYDSSGSFTISGYVTACYAHYSDTAGPGNYQKFPTVSPQSDVFSLNMAMLSAKYASDKFRGVITLHYGDIPRATWDPKFNHLQEANVGVNLYRRIWLDAGFFRTHIGLESIQPRENIATSLATTTYFEPYYMSGAKLTWAGNKLTLQLNMFNAYNGFSETNKNKAGGFSMAYQFTKDFSLNYVLFLCDESPAGIQHKQPRVYNNLYAIYKKPKIDIGAEVNYCYQENSLLSDPTKPAFMYSGLFSAKYRIVPKFACFGRFEWYEDDNEILTGPVINQNHQFVGLNILGGTAGVEWKIIPNSYLRLEGRYLRTTDNEKIFFYKNTQSDIRLEYMACLGVWF